MSLAEEREWEVVEDEMTSDSRLTLIQCARGHIHVGIVWSR